MDSTRDLSVGDLLDQLLADDLIDACHITGDFVTIVQGTKRHRFPYGQARTFLMGMLRGRSWNLKADETDPERGFLRQRGVQRRSDDVRAVLKAVAEENRDPNHRLDIEDPPPAPNRFLQSITPALDELLGMAVNMELIESSSKAASGRMVTISLSACQTKMRIDEAVVFLTECILHKLSAMREELLKLSDHAGRREAAGGFDRVDEPRARVRVPGDEPVWEPLG